MSASGSPASPFPGPVMYAWRPVRTRNSSRVGAVSRLLRGFRWAPAKAGPLLGGSQFGYHVHGPVGIDGDQHRLGLGDGRDELAQLAGEVVAEVMLCGLRQDRLLANGADAVRDGIAAAVKLPLQSVGAPLQMRSVHVSGE